MANRYIGFGPGNGAGGGVGGGGGEGVGGGMGGGRPPGAGTKKGDLFGDQYILLRDLDPNDAYDDSTPGDGDGEPVLDANGNPILVGSDGLPIYYVIDPLAEEGDDYILDPERAEFAQEVELGRANVARAPDKVMEKALASVLGKIDAATTVDTDAAGRLVLDGVTVDAPLENLALYQYLMTAGGDSSWPEVTEHWPEKLQALLGDDIEMPDWDPSSLLGAAFDKFSPITLDAVLYENTTLGVNTVTEGSDNLGNPQVDYFEFNDESTETYNYDRAERYGDVWIQWLEDPEGDGTFEYTEPTTVLDAVFGGEDWVDDHPDSGVNDFAQATDDARSVILFMHEELGAVEVPAPTSLDATDFLV